MSVRDPRSHGWGVGQDMMTQLLHRVHPALEDIHRVSLFRKCIKANSSYRCLDRKRGKAGGEATFIYLKARDDQVSKDTLTRAGVESWTKSLALWPHTTLSLRLHILKPFVRGTWIQSLIHFSHFGPCLHILSLYQRNMDSNSHPLFSHYLSTVACVFIFSTLCKSNMNSRPHSLFSFT